VLEALALACAPQVRFRYRQLRRWSSKAVFSAVRGNLEASCLGRLVPDRQAFTIEVGILMRSRRRLTKRKEMTVKGSWRKTPWGNQPGEARRMLLRMSVGRVQRKIRTAEGEGA